MLRISNLTFLISHPNSLVLINKQLKLTSGNQLLLTKSVGRVLSQGQIKWEDSFDLPYNNCIQFQISSKHRFGYNPEELDTVLQGKIVVPQKNTLKQLKTVTSVVKDLSGQKIGFLKADFRWIIKLTDTITKKSQTIPILTEKLAEAASISAIMSIQKPESPKKQQQKQQIIRISSIVAHVDQIRGKKIFLNVKCGTKVIKTQDFSSKAGQIVFIGDYLLKKQQNQTRLFVSICDTSQTSNSIVSSTAFQLNPNGKIQKKAQLKNSSNKSIGEMFLDGKVILKDPKSKMIQSLLYRHIDPQNSRYKDKSQAFKTTSVSKRKMSMVNSNNDIKFAKQKRFFGMEDKKSDYVSYQQYGSTLDFKQKSSKRFYKGASIGRGSKVYFIGESKINPGVGQYKLPSIWDRY